MQLYFHRINARNNIIGLRRKGITKFYKIVDGETVQIGFVHVNFSLLVGYYREEEVACSL